MRKFFSIIFFILTIFGTFAEDCEQDFDFFDELDLIVLETILETKIDEKSRKIELTLGVGPDTLFGGGGYGEGKGKGRTKEVGKQSGIYANEIDMKSGSLSLKGAYIVAKRGRISVRELMYQHLEDKHDYKNYSWYINSSPITMLANQFGKAAESMTPRNTTDGSAILGSLAFDHRSETRRGTTFATVAEGIKIETDSDISGLNRDASKLKEVTKDTKSHMSMMVPIVDFDKLKSNLKDMGLTVKSLKEKMGERFKEWKSAAAKVESPEQKKKAEESIAKLENTYEETAKTVENADVSSEEKVEMLVQLQLAVTESVDGPGIEVIESEGEGEATAMICLSTPEAKKEALDRIEKRLAQVSAENNEVISRLQNEIMHASIDVDMLDYESCGLTREQYQETSQKMIVFLDSLRSIDGLQLALDAAGFVPGLGIAPDVLNAFISLFRGHFLEAGMSMAAAVPIVGDFTAGAGKQAIRIARIAKQNELISKLGSHIQKQIKGMPIPKKWKTPNGGLLANELIEGNHVIEKHVGHDIAARLAKDTKLDLASTFPDLISADKFIGATINENLKNNKKLKKWLKNLSPDAKPTFTIGHTFSETVGKTLYQGSKTPIDVDKVMVVLKKDPTTKSGYSIFTAYPTDKINI